MLSRDFYETYWVQNISLIYLFVIFAVEQGGSGLTVFDSCYIPGSLLSLIWSKLMKRRQGQHQPWIGGPRAVTRSWVAFGKGDHHRDICFTDRARKGNLWCWLAWIMSMSEKGETSWCWDELRCYKWNSWGNELLSGVMSPLRNWPGSPGLQCYIYWTLIDPGWRDNLGNFLHHLFHHWFLCN